jgi:hypothetical protein
MRSAWLWSQVTPLLRRAPTTVNGLNPRLLTEVIDNPSFPCATLSRFCMQTVSLIFWPSAIAAGIIEQERYRTLFLFHLSP